MEQRSALGEKEPVWAWLGPDQLAKGPCSKKLGVDNRFLGTMERAHVSTQCNKTKKIKKKISNPIPLAYINYRKPNLFAL